MQGVGIKTLKWKYSPSFFYQANSAHATVMIMLMMTMTLSMTMTASVKMMMSLRGLRCTNPIYLINSADQCCLSPRQLELELIFKLVAHYLVEKSCLKLVEVSTD